MIVVADFGARLALSSIEEDAGTLREGASTCFIGLE
jgi:hypothetical protein